MDLLIWQIITHLLKLYDAQRNLVIIVNASQSDEDGLGEDLSNLGVRKPGLRQVGYEMNAKQRYVSNWRRCMLFKACYLHTFIRTGSNCTNQEV